MIERKTDNSHNSIIHYITHTTGACAVDAVTSSQIGLEKQKSYKFSKSMMCRAIEAQKTLLKAVPNIQSLKLKIRCKTR